MPDLSKILSGMMLMVDKPLEWTSFDVVNKIRYAIRMSFNLKKIKVGHAGTLDPMASGLLIICTGKMTKLIDQYQAQQKTYEGVMQMGASTPSYDQETAVNGTYSIDHFTEIDLHQQALVMTGEINQTPPIYSAIKRDGVPLYKLAREGKEVAIATRPVTIYSFVLTKIDLPEVHFNVQCSKGTYIRSLVHEFAQALDSGAYLKSLRRTAIGQYQLEGAWKVDELIEAINSIPRS